LRAAMERLRPIPLLSQGACSGRRRDAGADHAGVTRRKGCSPQKQLRFENQHDTGNRQRC
jgi:hypothetical protein